MSERGESAEPEGQPVEADLADAAPTPDPAAPLAAGPDGTTTPPPPPPPPPQRPSRRRHAARHSGPAGDEPDDPARRKKGHWWELPVLAAIAIVIAILVKSFLIQPFYIPSASMEKTLHGCPGCSGDRILVSKISYDFGDPSPGDVVVFHAPPGWDDEPASTPPSNPVLRVVRGFGQLIGFVPPDGMVLVKRVIAVGGQTVKGVSVNGRDKVMISDHGDAGPWRTLDEPFTYYDGPDSHATFGPVTVPAHRLWVMGDHRNDSADSRFHCDLAGSGADTGSNCDPTTSTVPDSDVIGKAVVIAWPPSRWRTLGTPHTFDHDAAAPAPGVAGRSAPGLTVGADAAAPAGPSPASPPLVATAALVPIWFLRRRRR